MYPIPPAVRARCWWRVDYEIKLNDGRQWQTVKASSVRSAGVAKGGDLSEKRYTVLAGALE